MALTHSLANPPLGVTPPGTLLLVPVKTYKLAYENVKYIHYIYIELYVHILEHNSYLSFTYILKLAKKSLGRDFLCLTITVFLVMGHYR